MNYIPILMYHNIAQPTQGYRLSSLYTRPSNFKRQMQVLNALGYKGLSLRKLQPYLKGNKQGKVFGISFDDGYQDNLKNAMPTLKELGFSASCYIVADLIGKTNQWCEGKNIKTAKLMTKDEIQQWIDAGLDIGSHSASHQHLTSLDEKNLEYEINSSKHKLETMFSLPIVDFCYPYGEYNDTVKACIKKAGYLTALSTVRARYNYKDDLLSLPRVHITKRTGLILFLTKIFTNYENNKK